MKMHSPPSKASLKGSRWCARRRTTYRPTCSRYLGQVDMSLSLYKLLSRSHSEESPPRPSQTTNPDPGTMTCRIWMNRWFSLGTSWSHTPFQKARNRSKKRAGHLILGRMRRPRGLEFMRSKDPLLPLLRCITHLVQGLHSSYEID